MPQRIALICKIKQDIRIYMLRKAGQTAGPIGLIFFVDTHGWPGVLLLKAKKIRIYFFKFFSWAL